MNAYTFYNRLPLSNDAVLILKYLNSHGVLNISSDKIEEYFQRFSYEICNADCVAISNEILEMFSYWLARQEI